MSFAVVHATGDDTKLGVHSASASVAAGAARRDARAVDLTALLDEEDDVLSVAEALTVLTEGALRWRLSTRRWQRPAAGVVVAHSGPLTTEQRVRVDLKRAGPDAVLAGLSAAAFDGLAGLAPSRTQVLLPPGRKLVDVCGLHVRRSCHLGPDDVHPARRPRRTRLARSLVDAAGWASSEDKARVVLAAGVQQRLARASDIVAVVQRRPKTRRRRLILHTLWDVGGGAHALSELDFLALCRRHGLPLPSRQVTRTDRHGRRRYLDVYWDEYHLVVEVDGMWHMEASQWWSDMWRDNELHVGGEVVLRYPSFAVRADEQRVADQLRRMLRHLGCAA